MNRVLATLVVALFACDLPWEPTLDEAIRDLQRRKGTLVQVHELAPRLDGETTVFDVTLTSSTGLVVQARVRRALGATADDPRAAAAVVGGVHTGRSAVDLLPNDNAHVAIGMEYPSPLDERDAATLINNRDAVREAVRTIPATISLLVDYLRTLDYVDPDRVVLIGVSFGGFLSPMTAAVDRHIENVALMYTGADLTSLVTESAKERVPDALAILGGDLALLGWQDMDPLRWIEHIAPRPILMVNGLDDLEVLNRSARALYEMARPPKEMVWLPTGHLTPEDTVLVRELVDTALARLPALQQ